VTVWSASTGRRFQTLRSPRGAIRTARWQPHTRAHILTAGDDGTVRLWDARSGTIVASLDTGSPLRDAVFDDRGSAVVTMGAESTTANVWYPKTGRTLVLRTLAAPRGQLLDATFDHSAKHVATTAINLKDPADYSVRIWDTRTGAVDAILRGHASYVTAIEFSPDDSTVATASSDRSVRTWNATTGDQLSVLLGHDSQISGLAVPRADLIETAGTGGDVRLWRTGVQQLADLRTRQPVDTVSFSNDGALVVAAVAAPDVGVELWPWKRGAAGRAVVIPVVGGASTASLSRDGHLVVVAAAHFERPSAPARVLRVPDGRTIGRPLKAGSENGAVTAAFSPDGRTILTGHRDGAARLWSSHSHRLLRRLGPTGAPSERITLRDAQFSGDGRRVATVGATCIARIFDTASGRQLHSFSAARGKPDDVEFFSAAFQPGGAQLATTGTDGLTLLWNVTTREPRPLPHGDIVNGVAFSPDGAVVATASWDGTARLWDARTAQPLGILVRESHGVVSVAFSRDGRRLATADATGRVRVVDCEVCGSVADLQRGARARVPRDLTPQERRDYLGETDG
jgi:WD40 repeat protein